MLKQILRDMYIDPEILAGLDETQKQTLFCKMREEQIRRWRIWDQKHEQLEKSAHENDYKPVVTFRQGEDGEPWVWVMGEHPHDLSIEEILANESKQRARELAEIETQELRKSYVDELSEIMEFDQESPRKKLDDVDLLASTPKIDEMEIYCSVDEIRDRINKKNIINNINLNKSNKETVSPSNKNSNNSFKQLQNIYNSRLVNFNLTSSQSLHDSTVLQEISTNKPVQKVSAKIALWEKRVIGEKTNEIYRLLQKKQMETAKEAEEAAWKREELWEEQERRAKEAEIQIRDIARRAREEHRKSIVTNEPNEDRINTIDNTIANSEIPAQNNNNNNSPPSSLDSLVSRPPSQEAVVKWYRDEEFPKHGGIEIESGLPYRWFHGLVSRSAAEQLLVNEQSGTFLVRLSEKIWGYAISYKDNDRIKHYLVDASAGTYQFLGANQLSHSSLDDLILYHANVPITLLGNELLIKPCVPNVAVPEILDGLLA